MTKNGRDKILQDPFGQNMSLWADKTRTGVGNIIGNNDGADNITAIANTAVTKDNFPTPLKSSIFAGKYNKEKYIAV